MGLLLKRRNTGHIINIVQDYMRNGKSINAFLADFDLSERKWKTFVKNNKKLQRAIQDGKVYYQAYWERRLESAMRTRKGNSTLEKLAFENILGWIKSAGSGEKENKQSMYKVYLDLGPEEGNEDKIIPEGVDNEK